MYLCVGKYFFQIYTKSSTHKEERLINLPTINSPKKNFYSTKDTLNKMETILHTGRV